MSTFNSCTKCVGSSVIIQVPANQLLGHACMNDLTIECSFDSQVVTWVMDGLGIFLDMLSLRCTTRHWHTYSRLVQEMNICRVEQNKLAFRGITVSCPSPLGKVSRSVSAWVTG